MRKIFAVFLAFCFGIGLSDAATRTQNALQRGETQNVSARQSNNVKNTTVSRATTRSNVTPRNTAKKTTSRTATKKTVLSRPTNNRNTLTSRTTKKTTQLQRAATTKTFGDNYNTCRDAYFTCMDLFCANQNEQYRRCVCSSRLYDIQNQEKKLYPCKMCISYG